MNDILNVIVKCIFDLIGYGYLMGVFAYFIPPESFPVGSSVAVAVRLLMLQAPTAQADWWGNFAGDLAWTIEPVVALVQSTVVQYSFQV